MMRKSNLYLTNLRNFPVNPNLWDFIALCLVLAVIVIMGSAAKEISAPYHIGQILPISLDPKYLPKYASFTIFRMIIALALSFLFTFIFGTWAAKSRRAEKIIIPMLDVLQSVPVLAFLSLTIVGFIKLFPGSMLGPQSASIFLIFTAQAWNMTFSLYQGLRTVPSDFLEAAKIFHLSAWQRYWRVEVPFCMPALLWNTMMSMSASWFSVVASEAISVSDQKITIPGVGSYIAVAIDHANFQAVFYAIIGMLLVILLYDQLLFRPLIAWSEKFRVEQTAQEKISRSWVMSILRRTRVIKFIGAKFSIIIHAFVNLDWFKSQKRSSSERIAKEKINRYLDRWWNFLLILAFIAAVIILIKFILHQLSLSEIQHVFLLGCITAARVLAILVISSLIWVPISVWIGLRPQVAEIVQPVAQFLAAFPANLLFPVFVIVIIKYHLNIEIWTMPLMMLGAQWYLVFNVIAGASSISKDLKQVADNFGLKGWLWWRRLVLPAIFPYYITGAITAVGGAWNASIVAEVVNWGNTTLTATGLGAYVSENTGNFAPTILGVVFMCLFVFTINHVFWRPLFNKASTYQSDWG